MALTRCPQCGRVADPPSCFACGYEWSTESTPAPAPVPVAAQSAPAAVPEAWSVPAVGSAPLKTPEPLPEPLPELAPEAPLAPARNVVQISDSLDELGDIFGSAPDGSPGVVAFSDVPLPEIDDIDDDLDASISELESELAAAAVPMDMAPAIPAEAAAEDPFAALENAFGPTPDRSPSGSVPLPEFNPEDDGVLDGGLADDLPVVQAMPETEAEAVPGGLPTDLFAEVDDTLAPIPTGPPPGVSAPPVAFAMPDPNEEELELDGLDIDALDLLDEEATPPALEPEPTSTSAPPPPAAPEPVPALDTKSAEELSTYKERLESYAENFEVEGRIGEAAFLYELKAFLDTLN